MTREVTARSIAATTHGRYLVSSPSNGPARGIVVGFHGYGENAEIHLECLGRIPGTEGWLLVAVQALHPFYNQRTQEIIASWMTRLDRDLAIADNIAYVRAVVGELREAHPSARLLVYAGFSQGVAMAYRAAARAGHECHGLIALAGDVPPELGADPRVPFPPVLIGKGRRDEWYTDEKLSGDLALLASKGVEHESLVFDGGHEWSEAFSAAAGRFLARLA